MGKKPGDVTVGLSGGGAPVEDGTVWLPGWRYTRDMQLRIDEPLMGALGYLLRVTLTVCGIAVLLMLAVLVVTSR